MFSMKNNNHNNYNNIYNSIFKDYNIHHIFKQMLSKFVIKALKQVVSQVRQSPLMQRVNKPTDEQRNYFKSTPPKKRVNCELKMK